MALHSENHKLLLLVEDEEHMMRLLKDALVGEGFDVVGTRSAEDALARISSDRPDLMVLDLMLPGLDGMSFLEKMRTTSWGKHLPVIILTNLSPDDKIMGDVVRDEPAYYLIKANTSMAEIVSKVKGVFEAGRAE